MSGDTAVVGAVNPADTVGNHAYVFTRSSNTWSQQTILPASGWAVALSGDTALVNGPSVVDTFPATHATVSVFTRVGDAWSQEATLNLPAGGSGTAVALSGDTALVGDWGGDSSPGAVYVFTRSLGIWSQQATLTASDGAAGDYFGSTLLFPATLRWSPPKERTLAARCLCLRALGNQLASAGHPHRSLASSQLRNFCDPVWRHRARGRQAEPGRTTRGWGGAGYIFTRSGDAWSP